MTVVGRLLQLSSLSLKSVGSFSIAAAVLPLAEECWELLHLSVEVPASLLAPFVGN